MRRVKISIAAVLFLCVFSSLALGNGLNLNSLGSKALAMGGAFVGLANDYSAIYWNPAGISLFNKKYFGFYGSDIIPTGKYRLDVDVPPIGPVTVVNATTETKHYLSGMVTYYHPVSEKVVVGLGVYVPSGLGAQWDGQDFAAVSGGNPSIEWKSKIGMVTFSPVLSFKISDAFSIGATFNVNYAKFNIAMYAGESDAPLPVVDLGQYEETMNGWGYGATIGVLFKPIEKLSFGLTYRTASTVKLSGEATISGMDDLGTALGTTLNETSDIEREVTMPLWIAGGVAFEPIEGLTLTGDLQWTQWSTIDVMETTFVDTFWAQMMEASGDDARPMYWEDALQIRIGAEYRMKAFSWRGGYYYDPSPAPDTTMNVLLPIFDFNAFTAGFGYSLNGLNIDFGMEYLKGKERFIDPVLVATNPDYATAMPGTYNMTIWVATVAVSYKF